MTDRPDNGLEGTLAEWVRTLPHAEAVRRYRALRDSDRFKLIAEAWDEVGDAFRSGESYGDRLENLARRFDVFSDGERADLPGSSPEEFRRTATHLRHPDEWRASERARNPVPERRLEALALASACWSDEPTEVRLRRIEEVLPQLNQLADQAAAEGNLSEQSAIGTDIGDLWKLRDALRRTS